MKKIYNAIAKVGMKSAVKACGSASILCCYQPKEPKVLRKIKK